MTIRQAISSDIPQIQIVRNAVKENSLSNPALVTDADCGEYINIRGRGWVAEVNEKIVGFAIADLKDNNIWALFLLPEFEKQGIGKKLHDKMMNWFFQQTTNTCWLGTAPNTRAASFYKAAGWKEVGMNGSKEIKLEMMHKDWINKP